MSPSGQQVETALPLSIGYLYFPQRSKNVQPALRNLKLKTDHTGKEDRARIQVSLAAMKGHVYMWLVLNLTSVLWLKSSTAVSPMNQWKS